MVRLSIRAGIVIVVVRFLIEEIVKLISMMVFRFLSEVSVVVVTKERIVLLGRTKIVLVVIMMVNVVVLAVGVVSVGIKIVEIESMGIRFVGIVMKCMKFTHFMVVNRTWWCVDWAATVCVHVGGHRRWEGARQCTVGASIG